jgi:hypothetical protein
MRRALHGLLLVLSMPFLLLAASALGFFTLFATWAEVVLPDARFGNCFTFAAARWARYGGYVTLRTADDVTVLGLPIPHALWQAELGGPVRMTYPVQRRSGHVPWWAILFRFDVWCSDTPRQRSWWVESSVPSEWQDTGPPRA